MANKKMQTLEDIKARCIDDGGCWIWQGSMSGGGTVPSFKNDHKNVAVRRFAVELSGVTLMPKRCVVAQCGNKHCVNPDHAVQLHRSQLLYRNMQSANQLKLNAGRARAARKRLSKLTMQDARDIRTSSKSVAELMDEYEISKSSIYDIRRGTRWKDYTNPFAQLMRGYVDWRAACNSRATATGRDRGMDRTMARARIDAGASTYAGDPCAS